MCFCGYLSFQQLVSSTECSLKNQNILYFILLYLDLSLITKIINWSFEDGCFPGDLKIAELGPIFTKDSDVSQR